MNSAKEPHEQNNDKKNVDEKINSNTKKDIDPKTDHTPVQKKLNEEISNLRKKLNALFEIKESGLATDETNTSIDKYQAEINNKNKSLNKLIKDQEYHRKYRKNKKIREEQACEISPEVAKVLRIQKNPGRPRIENMPEHEQLGNLYDTIVDIVNIHSGADGRRRTEAVGYCKSVKELKIELNRRGYNISESATYTRLLPRRQNTAEGKRHTVTAPVKLMKAQTSEHKKHIDSQFCLSTIRDLETLASFLGFSQVFFLSQDDKALVPIGITADNKQRSILMSLKYKITLPDHDWVKAPGHKLIPSVYAGIKIKENGIGDSSSVTYSGPTFISIRSSKHDTSNASTHAYDFQQLLESESFKTFCKNVDESIKPVIIITTDGGPDENPRYEKVIKFAISHFKKYDLDALFLVTNAPGRSAFNRVERRMAPLSHALSGLVLDYDFYGSHLDDSGKTIDVDLEKNNFKHAGNTLSEIWSSESIAGYSVEAKYIEDKNLSDEDLEIDQLWFSNHVRSSQYLLQIVKCDSKDCCKNYRSSIKNVLPDRFLPPPVKVKDSDKGIVCTGINDPSGKFLPFFTRIAVKIKPNTTEFKKVCKI